MTTRRRPIVVSALAALALAACGSAGGPPSVSPSAPAVATATATPTPAPAGMVAIILMENHSLDQVINQPYLSSLANRGVVLSGYHSVSHPSEPNYLAITSGQTWGISDDAYHVLPSGQDLGAQLTTAGVSWKGYMEGLTGAGCKDSPGPYAVRHNPFAFYGGACPSNVVAYPQLAADESANQLPRVVWVTPNLCNDDHDCPTSTGDAFLATVVPGLMAQPSFANHGVLFIVWDEGDEDGSARYNEPAALVLSPDLLHPGTSVATTYNHYNVLATIEKRLGLPLLGNAAQASPLPDVLQPVAESG